MPIVQIIPTDNVDATIRYINADKADQAERGERVLDFGAHGVTYIEAARGFERTRRVHGKPGYRHTVRDESGAPTGETTFIEGLHVIISFEPDELADDGTLHELPDGRLMASPQLAIEHGMTMLQRQMPGYQFVGVAQADGDSGNLHTHWVVNTVAYRDAEFDGYSRRAGRLLTGALTDVNRVKASVDEACLDLGIVQNQVPVNEYQPKDRTVNRTDRQMARRGERSRRDVLRDLIDAEIAAGTSYQGLMDALHVEGWNVVEHTKTSGKYAGRESLRFEPIAEGEDFHNEANGKKALLGDGTGRQSDLGRAYTKPVIVERIAEVERQKQEETAKVLVVEPEMKVGRKKSKKPVEVSKPVEKKPVEPKKPVVAPVPVVEPIKPAYDDDLSMLLQREEELARADLERRLRYTRAPEMPVDRIEDDVVEPVEVVEPVKRVELPPMPDLDEDAWNEAYASILTMKSDDPRRVEFFKADREASREVERELTDVKMPALKRTARMKRAGQVAALSAYEQQRAAQTTREASGASVRSVGASKPVRRPKMTHQIEDAAKYQEQRERAQAYPERQETGRDRGDDGFGLA